jgi:hypothetical protein
MVIFEPLGKASLVLLLIDHYGLFCPNCCFLLKPDLLQPSFVTFRLLLLNHGIDVLFFLFDLVVHVLLLCFFV